MNDRSEREILHGKYLAEQNPELMWGWGTPAGKIRANRRAERIIQGADITPHSRVLEIGCGTGNFSERFAKTGCDLTAIDISEDLLSKARERNLSKDRVRFLLKRFEDCDLESPYDAVIGSSILHHLEIDEALPVIYRLLKPGGIMSFAEPNMLNPQIFLERNFRRLFSYISPDETAFIRWVLKNRLSKIGFQEIEIKPLDWLHPAVPENLIKLISNIEWTLDRIPLVKEFAGSLYIRAKKNR